VGGSRAGKLGSRDYRWGLDGHERGEGEKLAAKKASTAGVHVVTASSTGAGNGAAPKGPDRVPRKCKFSKLT
jgi:hypothetical protein